MDEQKNFIEKVDEVIELGKQTQTNIFNLVSGLDSLSQNIKELKKIETLNTSLKNLDSYVKYIDNCNAKLNSVFKSVDDQDKLTKEIDTAKQAFNDVQDKLGVLNDLLDTIIENKDGIDITDICEQMTQINNTFGDLKDLSELKQSFDNYKKENDKLIEELRDENENIKNYCKATIETNQAVMKLFRNLNQNNEDIEKYINNIMDKWYKENVTILGIKRNKKDKSE